MLRVLYLIGLCLLLCSTPTQAQQGRQTRPDLPETGIAGVVTDPVQTPIPYASVALYKTQDSSLVRGTATNENGRFVLPADPGNYYLILSFLSYENRTIENITVEQSLVRLGKLALEEDHKTLSEFVVEAEKASMELKLDKRVFNVNKDMANAGRNMAEILDNIPSVAVDVEGNVSLRGSENVRILIDGKPSSLTGMGNAEALRLLQGDMVESVEVITNPSSRYDAEGEAGIINIVLKKEKKSGVNGNFEARVGIPQTLGASFLVNYRKNKVNFFLGYGVNQRLTPGIGNTEQTNTLADTTYYYETESDRIRGGLSHNIRLGTDIQLNDNNSLTLAGMANAGNGNNPTDLIYRDYDENRVLTRTTHRNETELMERQTFEGSAHYRRTFKKKGQQWTADAQYSQSEDFEDATIIQTDDDSETSDLTQRATTLEKRSNMLFQTDYVHPFAKDGKAEAGLKANLRVVDNDFLVQEEAEAGEWVTLPGLQNHVVYNENIYAAYIMAGNKTGKLSYQAGLRGELSDVLTESKLTGESNHRVYFNIFPSVQLSHEFRKEEFIQLSYSKRINRPRFWWILPFYNYSDSRNINVGNPNINPEFTHSTEMGYMKKKNKATLLASIFYRYTENAVERIEISDSNGVVYRFPINLGQRHSAGVELSGTYEPYKWWNMTLNLNGFRRITEGEYQGTSYDADTWGWTGRFMSRWKVKRKFSLQTTFNYRSPIKTTQGRRLYMFGWDLGAALEVLKGNGTLSLSGRDVLNSRIRRTETTGPNFENYTEFQWRSRSIVLSFNYRLNQKAKRGGRSSRGFDGGDDIGR